MTLVPPVSRAHTRRLVRSTLTETVVLLGPPAEAQDALGAATYGARPELGTMPARVTPEPQDERVAADRLDAPEAYVVRVEARAELADGSTVAEALAGPDASSHALRWDRPARLGGAVVLELSGRPADDHGRGRFLDLACVYAGQPAEVPA